MKLKWTKSQDDNGNTAYEAPGPYVDLPDRWRLEKRLRNDRIVWMMANVGDGLGTDWDMDWWPKITRAKAEIERIHTMLLHQSERS